MEDVAKYLPLGLKSMEKISPPWPKHERNETPTLIRYSTRIEELVNSREAISGKRLGFIMKFFTTKCTYRCTMLFKVLEPFQWIHFFSCKNFFFSFLTILATKITPKKIPLKCMLLGHIYTNFFFRWRFSANFCAYGTQNSKNTKSGIFPKVFNKIAWFLAW